MKDDILKNYKLGTPYLDSLIDGSGLKDTPQPDENGMYQWKSGIDGERFQIVLNTKNFAKSAILKSLQKDKNLKGQYFLKKTKWYKQIPMWIRYYYSWYLKKGKLW